MTVENHIFERCPHDRENPYTMINRDLIRDKSISPECRWLIIYLLSHRDGWKIHMREVVNHCQGQMGRDKVYKVVNEAIEAGYILRTESFTEKNLKRVGYHVSEFPKFKKCLRHPDFQEPENPDDKERASSKNNNPSSKDISLPDARVRARIREEHVEVSDKDHEKLVKEFGEERTKRFYKFLSDWKIDTPKWKWKKNDYRSIRRWVILAEEKKSLDIEKQKLEKERIENWKKNPKYPIKSKDSKATSSAKDTPEPTLVPLSSLMNTECSLTAGLNKKKDFSCLPEGPDVEKPTSVLQPSHGCTEK